MKGIISLAYSLAVDKLVKERERRNKVIEAKNELREITSIIVKSRVDPNYKSRVSRKLIEFSNSLIKYDTNELDNVLEFLNTIKLGAKVLHYTSESEGSKHVAKGLEDIVKKVDFLEFVEASDFQYELINTIDSALEGEDYIVSSFKNKTLLELRNKVKFERVVYNLSKNFATTAPNYFLDKKFKTYEFKKRIFDGNEAVLYFSHGKTVGIKYSNKFKLGHFDDDINVIVVPQLNKEEKELVTNYFDKSNLLFVYSISENKFYYNKKDARTLYFAEYLKTSPKSSDSVLVKVAKKRGNYASRELGVSDSALPVGFDDESWRW